MPVAGGILVDTSVWVKFFRLKESREGLHLDVLLEAAAVRICAPIRAEILSGARTERERARLRELLEAVELLELPPDLWEQVEEGRFTLARKGHQCSLVDLMIAATASHHRVPFWTLDDDFFPIQRVMPFARYLPWS